MNAQHTPELVPVTKDQFFAFVGPRNVHPRAEREHSIWIDLNTHAVIGVSTPGYANPSAPAAYALYRKEAA